MLDWLACSLVQATGAVLCRLPVSVAVWIGERFGLLAYRLQPRRARIGLANLRAAFDGRLMPRELQRILRASYRQLGAGVVELLCLPRIDRAYIDRYLEIEGRGHFESAAASGKPVILLTGHFGNWELSSIAAALQGYPIVALARAQNKLPRLYRLLVSYRESKGCTIVHKGGAMKRLIEAIDQGRLIGIVADQASRQGIFVEFFGRPALFATGPFELALKRDALILPAFMHRRHGPFHRLVVEPPISLSASGGCERAVRQGIEAFAAALTRHIQEEPWQWLWMHKRWKFTTARRVLVLSDGKLGHLKQSLAIAGLLREQHPTLTHQVVEVRYRCAWRRLITLVWARLLPGLGGARCLRWALSRESARALLTRYADLIISCGSSLAPVTLLWAREQRAKSVVIMNPAPLPVKRFSLVIAPRHDRLPGRANVVPTAGAIVTRMREDDLRLAQERLHGHPRFRGPGSGGWRHPVIAVFVGGDTADYALTPGFADSLAAQVKALCDATDGWCLVTTSRRTPPGVERLLAERLSAYPRCALLLIANRDPLDGTMEGMLGCADVAVVTGESISMVCEACASGRPVVVIEPPLRASRPAVLTKHGRFLRDLVAQDYIRLVRLPELGLTIRRALQAREPAKRLDNLDAIRAAASRLL